MRKLLLAVQAVIVVLIATAGIAAAATPPPVTPTPLSPPAGTPTPGTPTPPPPGKATPYVDPFSDPHWIPGRIDMGMDWAPLRRLPVLALGDAVILGADNHAPWPGHHIIWYQLTDGPLQGDVVYVAEHLTSLARAGAAVRAGQRIAVALPGYPYIETGWADAYGSPRAYPCYREGMPTNSGKEIARFLGTLGAPLGITLHRVAARPSGRLC